MEIVPLRTAREMDEFCSMSGSVTLTPSLPSVRQADEHWLVRGRTGLPLARCSLWWTAAPAYPNHKLGLIGHYAAGDDQAAAALLNTACRQLIAHGCSLAVGPIDGSTFRYHRLVTERALDGIQRPSFFLEPDNPDAWPRHFVNAGFEPLSSYISAIGQLAPSDPRMAELAERAADAGITVREVHMESFTKELERIYEIVTESFTDNFLYSPIDREEFLAQYTPIQPHIRPEIVLIAEQDASPVGFAFTLPDLAQRQRGRPIDTLIVKTVAVRPEVAGHGLGSLLVARVQTAAYAMGLQHLIHALMHETNISRKISARYATPMRRYTLFAKDLTA
jgi:GNAT superfamily N-acetyltransferase